MSPEKYKPGAASPGGRTVGRSGTATLEPLRAEKGPPGRCDPRVLRVDNRTAPCRAQDDLRQFTVRSGKR